MQHNLEIQTNNYVYHKDHVYNYICKTYDQNVFHKLTNTNYYSKVMSVSLAHYLFGCDITCKQPLFYVYIRNITSVSVSLHYPCTHKSTHLWSTECKEHKCGKGIAFLVSPPKFLWNRDREDLEYNGGQMYDRQYHYSCQTNGIIDSFFSPVLVYVLRSSRISRKSAGLILRYSQKKEYIFLCFLLFWESVNYYNFGSTGQIQVGFSVKCTSLNEDFN